MPRAINWMKSTGFCVAAIIFICVLYLNINRDNEQSRQDRETIARLEADLHNLRRQLGLTVTKQDHENEVLLYNRVPKTGSTSFAGLLYDLCSKNGYTVLHVNTTHNTPTLSVSDQSNESRDTDKEGNHFLEELYSEDGGTTFGDAIGPAVRRSNTVPMLNSDKDIVVIYNRVPKTGSTTFANVFYSLYRTSDFTVIYVRAEKNANVYSVPDQMRFVQNVTLWNEKKPVIYHGHFAYIDFSKFGSNQRPIYINIVREPLERLISYYYFLRHGDNFRPHLKRRKSNNKESFDECVMKSGHDCDSRNLWMQIPFFCGHAADCWVPGNPWALDMAKFNLVNNYLLVGVTEDMGNFVAVLEATLPRFFHGATKHYNLGEKSHLRQTVNKTLPADETMRRMRDSDIYRMELEFYQFAKEQFEFIKYRTFEVKDGFLEERKKQFMYEKIKPR